MSRYFFRTAVATLVAALAVSSARAQVVTTTSPNGWFFFDGKTCAPTCPGPDPATITGAKPFAGNGSLQFTVSGTSQQPVAYYPLAKPISLQSLNGLGFSYLAALGEVGDPVLRLDLSGLSNTGGSSSGSLGWYGPTPAGGWTTDAFTLTNGNFFFRTVGKGQAATGCGNTSYTGGFSDRLQTIQDWIDACTGLLGTINLGNAVVNAVQVDYGSFPGLVGSTSVYADGVNFSLGSENSLEGGNFNFELAGTVTPEPATMTLLGIGLVGLLGSKRRKRPR
ncbi:MAG: PEP-CTERM sorting domain-containing protein [Gemmatimonadales bacterium]